MTDDTKRSNEDHADQHQPDDHEHHEPDLDSLTVDTGEDPRRGRGRRFDGHHVHHVHVHHHLHGRGRGRGGPARRGGGRRGLEERIELLEQVQRDLEQDVADVAAKIARLRARAAEETTSAPESSAT